MYLKVIMIHKPTLIKFTAAVVWVISSYACSPNNVTIDTSIVKMMDSASVVEIGRAHV